MLVMFFVMTNVAFGAVGDGSVSDGASSIQPGQSYSTGAAVQSAGSQFTGYQAASAGASSTSYGSYAQHQSNQPVQSSSQSAKAITTSVPQISGPYQESMAAEDLDLSQPVADSFRPDESLGFVSATLPSSLTAGAVSATYGGTTGSMTASSPWYYPGSVVSPNKFYVQTSYGLATVGGCSYGGYLPLWADISSGGNLFVYEWYPGQSTPYVRLWDWTWAGLKKGWFYGDVAGWHILCYNCRDWSNYVYIYVYPTNVYSNDASGHANLGKAQTYLQTEAPTPPNPNSESLVLPDYSMYKPYAGQTTQAVHSSYPAQSGYPVQSGYPAQVVVATQVTGGVSSSYPYQGSCPTCTASGSLTAPYGYSPQSYQAVYPTPSTCRCNEYYVQYYTNKICTVAGMYCGEWLPLWSKVSRPGVYWSYEWKICKDSKGYYCSPEVKNFGYKSTGWYQTWFEGNDTGWHILSYHCSDWSNYVYIYVWPAY